MYSCLGIPTCRAKFVFNVSYNEIQTCHCVFWYDTTGPCYWNLVIGKDVVLCSRYFLHVTGLQYTPVVIHTAHGLSCFALLISLALG